MVKNSKLDSLLKLFRLKDEKRTGWVLRGVEHPESVADHSWGTALLVLLFASSERVDVRVCLGMAAVHDIAEAVTGDIATRVDPAEQRIGKKVKQQMEMDAIRELSFGLSGEAVGLWEEYEAAETIEARFVRDMNLIDMCLQALFYESENRYTEDPENRNFRNFEGLDEFFATSGPRVTTDTGKELWDAVKARYDTIRKQKKDTRQM